MTKEQFDGYTYIEGGVCAAKGFLANGLNCGINPDKKKNDLGMIYSEKEAPQRQFIRKIKLRVHRFL